MAVKLKLEEDGKIYAGVFNKRGRVTAHYNEVTEEAILTVMQHILDTKKSGTDAGETLEFEKPFLRHGSRYHKYKVSITLTPVE